MSESLNLDELLRLVKIKKEDPKAYKEILIGMADISKDIMRIAMKTAEEMSQ